MDQMHGNVKATGGDLCQIDKVIMLGRKIQGKSQVRGKKLVSSPCWVEMDHDREGVWVMIKLEFRSFSGIYTSKE